MAPMEVQNIGNIPNEILFYVSNINGTYASSATSSVLFFVIAGIVDLLDGDHDSTLRKDDFVIVNASRQIVFASQSTQTIVCGVEIPAAILRNVVGAQTHQFDCNSTLQTSMNHHEVQRLMKQLIKYTSNATKQNQTLLQYSMYFELVDLLCKKFLVVGKDTLYGSDRLNHALTYIHANHHRKLTLDEMADMMFMSRSYFSRYFKQETGINFIEYLRNVRLEKALLDIKQSDKPITQIAFDAGFSSTNAFGQSFKERYGISPSEYRKETQANHVNQLSDIQFALDRQQDVFMHQEAWDLDMNQDVKIDYQKFTLRNMETKQIYFQGLSYMYVGTARTLIDGKFQKQLIGLTKSLHLGGLIVDELFDEHQYTQSDAQSFAIYKTMIDFVIENRYQVIFMIPMHASIKDKLAVIVDGFLAYLLSNYNVSYIANFHFAFDFLTTDYEDDWISTCNGIIQSIKKISKDMMVGGPTIALDSMDFYHMHPSILNDIRFDFLSCTYFSDIAQCLDTTMESYFSAIKNLLLGKQTYLKDKIYVIRYNTSNQKSYLHDSIFKASQVMSELIRMLGLVQVVSYAPISDFVLDSARKDRLLDGSGGLMTQDGIYKPVFYTFKFMRHICSGFIFANEHFLVSKDDSMRLSILAHNLHYDALASKNRHDFQVEMDTSKINANTKKVFTFVISDMLDGYHEIRSYGIGQTKGNLIHEWSKWDYKDYSKKGDLDYLKSVTHPELLIKAVDVKDGKLYLDVELEPNAFSITYIDRKNR